MCRLSVTGPVKSRRIDSAAHSDWRWEPVFRATRLGATLYPATRYSVALLCVESLNMEPKPAGNQQHPLLNLPLKRRLTL